jgi:hypothetical protein
MFYLIGAIVLVVLSFIGGILVGRNNASKVDAVVNTATTVVSDVKKV